MSGFTLLSLFCQLENRSNNSSCLSALGGLDQVKHCPQCVAHSDCLIHVACKTNSSELIMAKGNQQFLPVLCFSCLPTSLPDNADNKNCGIQLQMDNYIEMELTHRR